MTLTVTNVVEVVTNICVRRGPAGLEWRRPDEGSNLDDLCDRDRYRRGGAKAAPSRRSGNVRMRDLRRLLSAPDVRPPVLAGTRSAGPTEGRPRPPPPRGGKAPNVELVEVEIESDVQPISRHPDPED